MALRFRLRRLPLLPSLLALAGFCVLCALGTWQLHRLARKTDIMRQLDAATAAPEVLNAGSLEGRDFAYGRIEGIFLPDKAVLLGPRTRKGASGYGLIVPLKMKDGVLLVDMGWTSVADINRLPIHHAQGKEVRFEGLARQPGWNSFTPPNDPARDVWFRANIREIAAAKGLDDSYPYILSAGNASYKFDAAFPNNERWRPVNDHAYYAAFWFTMAAVLAAVFTPRFAVFR